MSLVNKNQTHDDLELETTKHSAEEHLIPVGDKQLSRVRLEHWIRPREHGKYFNGRTEECGWRHVRQGQHVHESVQKHPETDRKSVV